MTREEYQQLLDKHDWTYIYSDSSTVYDRGIKNERYLKSFHTDIEFRKMYEEKEYQVFHDRIAGPKEFDNIFAFQPALKDGVGKSNAKKYHGVAGQRGGSAKPRIRRDYYGK